MKQSLIDVKSQLREAGLRATPSRTATFALMRRSNAPLTHAEVAEKLSDEGIDKATVFRNLNDLSDAGLLRRTELGDHVYRFETIPHGESDKSAHPHFFCVDCGTVSCLGDVQLTAGSLRRSESVGEITEILLRGHCNDCRSECNGG